MSEVTSEENAPVEDSAPTPSSMRRYVVIGIVIVFVGFLGWGLFTRNQTQPTSGSAPEFTLTLFEGYYGNVGQSPIKLSDLRGKVVLINFWASWCIPCADEAPDLQAAYDKYKDRGVVFLGVDWTDIETDARNYLKRFGITYANGPDLGNEIAKPLYHITGVPETYIVDKEGNVQFQKISPVREAELAQVFERLLK